MAGTKNAAPGGAAFSIAGPATGGPEGPIRDQPFLA